MDDKLSKSLGYLAEKASIAGAMRRAWEAAKHPRGVGGRWSNSESAVRGHLQSKGIGVKTLTNLGTHTVFPGGKADVYHVETPEGKYHVVYYRQKEKSAASVPVSSSASEIKKNPRGVYDTGREGVPMVITRRPPGVK